MDARTSFILPVCNNESFLNGAIECLIAQSNPNWELIIIDDASNDRTPQILTDWSMKDERVSGIRNFERRGIPSSINRGIQESQGEWITWFHVENRLKKDFLGKLSHYLDQHPTMDGVYSAFEKVHPKTDEAYSREFYPIHRLIHSDFFLSSFLIRRYVFESLQGFDEGMSFSETYDFWLKVSNYFRIGSHPSSLFEHRKSFRMEHPNKIQALEKNLNHLRWLDPNLKAQAHLRIFQDAFESGNREKAIVHLKLSMEASKLETFRTGARKIRDRVKTIYQKTENLRPSRLMFSRE